MSLTCCIVAYAVSAEVDRRAIEIYCGPAPGFSVMKIDCAMDLAADKDERLLVDKKEDRLLVCGFVGHSRDRRTPKIK